MSAFNILVAVKPVPDHDALVSAAEGGEVEIEDRWIINFFDEIAVEQAVRLKESASAHVTAICVAAGRGAAKCAGVLRKALAMGADRIVMVQDPALEEADGLGIARVIAAFAKKEGMHMILLGKSALDDEQGLVGPALSQIAAMPYVGGIIGLELKENASLRLTRLVEGGDELVEAGLPAACGVSKGLCEPGIPKVMKVMKASKAKPETLDLAGLGLAAENVAPLIKISSYSAPPDRPPATILKWEGKETASKLAQIIREMAGGG